MIDSLANSLKSIRSGLLPLAALIVLLNGCARLPFGISPHARQLDPNNLDAGTFVRSSADSNSTWPTTTWWKAYGDPQLDRLVEEATAGNPSLRMAEARIVRAHSLAEGAKAPLWPSVNAGTTLTYEHFTENQFYKRPYAGEEYWNNRATFDLAYNLDLWGKNRSALAAALDYVKVADAEARVVKLSLETAVVRTYVQLALRFVEQDIARTTLRQRMEILDITQKRLAAGIATEFERSQAEAPVPAARAELERIAETIDLLRNQLSALAGKGPGFGEGIVRPTLSLNAPISVPSALPADLVGRRPDVAAQRWRVEAAGKNIKVAKAAFYPNINLAAFVGWSAIGFAKFLSGGSLVYGMGPAVSLPIFEGGRLRSQLGATTADYDIAVESYNLILIQALQDVSNSLITLRSQDKQRVEEDRAYALAERAYGIALRGYRAGLTDYLHVLNAQNQTLIEAQRMAQIEARRKDAHAQLMQALGGGATEEPHIAALPAGSANVVPRLPIKAAKAAGP
jgi:NodT family efflux transporter outer membrane factor (OMF) lipoprotein